MGCRLACRFKVKVKVIVVYIAFFAGGVRPSLRNRRLNLKNWMPILDMDGPEFGPKFLAGNAEWKFNHFMRSAGTLSSKKWKATRCLWCENFFIQTIRNAQEPRNSRRQNVDTVRRKELSLHIQKLHRQELPSWKSTQLSACLCNSLSWKMLRGMLRTPGHEIADQPHVDDFAKMLRGLFHGDPAPPMTMRTLTEPPWTMAELRHAISLLKSKKSGDDLGFVAELLKAF